MRTRAHLGRIDRPVESSVARAANTRLARRHRCWGSLVRRGHANPMRCGMAVHDARPALFWSNARITGAAVAVAVTCRHAERPLEARPTRGLSTIRIEPVFKPDARRVRAGARVGFAVEKRAVSTRLRCITEAVAKLRAVERRRAAVANLMRATEEPGAKKQRGKKTSNPQRQSDQHDKRPSRVRASAQGRVARPEGGGLYFVFTRRCPKRRVAQDD